MASGDGKSNPFGNGSSGAVGNGSGESCPGIAKQRGPDRPQKMGATNFNPDSVSPGGRVLKLDPKGDRQGMIGQNAQGMTRGKPFKLGSGPSYGDDNGEPDDVKPAGQIPQADESDGGSDD